MLKKGEGKGRNDPLDYAKSHKKKAHSETMRNGPIIFPT